MATSLDLEIASLVACARQLRWMIYSTHYPRYPVLEGNICSDGNLTGVSLAKALIQQCTKGIEDIVLEFDRMLFNNGFCENLSFTTSVATPRPLIICCDHIITIVAYLKKRMRQQDYSNVSLISTQIRDTPEHLQQDQSFVRCERQKSDICELKSELKDKDMLIELITGLVGDECPRIYEIINQYHQQLNHTENQHKQKQVDELTERIQLLETDNSHWQCVVKENIKQLNDCQTKNLLLETRKNDWKSAAKKKGQQLKECQARIQLLERENNDLKCDVKENEQQLKECQSKIQFLETENNDLKCVVKAKDQHHRENQAKFEELQRQLESTVNNTTGRYEDEMKLKQEMHNLSESNLQLQELLGNWSHLQTVKEEEIKHLNQTYDDLSARNNALEDELSYFKRRLDVREEALITIKKDNGELLMRSDELEKEVTGFKQTLSLRDAEQKTMRKENEEILTKVCELKKEVKILKRKLNFREEELNSINQEKEHLVTRNNELEDEVSYFKQMLDVREEELIQIKKDSEDLLMSSDELEKEVTGFKQTLSLRDEELMAMKKENEEVLTRVGWLEKEVTILEQRLSFREEELNSTNKQKEDLLTRLSQYTSAQLVHDNPNVADLSDLNRPTKLAEKVSELYDNEWTDGFEVLTEDYKFTERDAIRQLLDILLAAYSYCTKISSQQERVIKQAFLSPAAENVREDAKTELNSVQLRTIFDLRKQTSHWSLITVQKSFLDDVKTSSQNSLDAAQLIKYINQCAELCWHMVIRSPPLVFESPASEGDEFDKTKYRFYQTSGINLNFVVWPILRLHEDGPLLSKGIAEAM